MKFDTVLPASSCDLHLSYSVTDVKTKPLARQGRPFQTGNCREMPPVATVGCIRWSVTVSGNKNATSSSVVLQQELVSLLSAGSKRKGRLSVCGVSSEDA